MSTVPTYSLKPDTVYAMKLEPDATVLQNCAKWCNGTLTLKFGDGVPVAHGTAIALIEGSGREAKASIGDYIIQYIDTEKHGEGFYVANGENFESVYQQDMVAEANA